MNVKRLPDTAIDLHDWSLPDNALQIPSNDLCYTHLCTDSGTAAK